MASQARLNLRILSLLPINKVLTGTMAIAITLASFPVFDEAHIAIARPKTWTIAKKTTNHSQAMQRLSGSNWKLNRWDNSSNNNDTAIDSLTIEFTKSKISGFGGCNHFSGTYRRQRNRLTISDLNYTTRGCETLIMRREESFLGAIAAVKKVRFIKNRLLLDYQTSTGESGVLEFSKINNPKPSTNTPDGNVFPNPSSGNGNSPLGTPGVSQ
jgi:heat shock protein HslJ